MAEVPRISAEEAHAAVASGRALLVCGYEDPERYRLLRLEGGISIQEFRGMLPSLSKEQEIIFYCA
ncbi:MAG TPA: ArsR family transcriptional regulator [Geobacteraceae bacterium]